MVQKGLKSSCHQVHSQIRCGRQLTVVALATVQDNVRMRGEIKHQGSRRSQDVYCELELVQAELRELSTRYQKLLKADSLQKRATQAQSDVTEHPGGARHPGLFSSNIVSMGSIAPSRLAAHAHVSSRAGATPRVSGPLSGAPLRPSSGSQEKPAGLQMIRSVGVSALDGLDQGKPNGILLGLIGLERERVTDLMAQFQLYAEQGATEMETRHQD